MAGHKGSGEKPPPPHKPAARWVKRAAPAAPEPAKPARHNTIEVSPRWLIPSLPEIAKVLRPKRSERPPSPPPLPASLAVKPRGKLPPALPREDRDGAPTDPPRSPAGAARPSKRPPRGR